MSAEKVGTLVVRTFDASGLSAGEEARFRLGVHVAHGRSGPWLRRRTSLKREKCTAESLLIALPEEIRVTLPDTPDVRPRLDALAVVTGRESGMRPMSSFLAANRPAECRYGLATPEGHVERRGRAREPRPRAPCQHA